MGYFLNRAKASARYRGGRAVEALKRRIPPSVSGYLDTFQPDKYEPWGGPFNGQARRQQVFADLCRQVPFAAVVETGTFRGSTTSFLHRTSKAPVFSAEIMPRYYHFSRRRLRKHRGVTVFRADSRAFLGGLREAHPELRDQPVFFYLDAHWLPELPLGEELTTVANGWERPVIMVDDFEVPGDGEYGFDDYGPGRRLCVDYLPPAVRSEFRAYFPAVPAAEETGSRRGFVLLARPEFDAALGRVPGLRSEALSPPPPHTPQPVG